MMNPDTELRIRDLYQSDKVKGTLINRSKIFMEISRSIWELNTNFMISNRIKNSDRMINKIKIKEPSLKKKFKDIINSAGSSVTTLEDILIGKEPIIEDMVGFRFVYTKPKDLEDAINEIEDTLTVKGCNIVSNDPVSKNSGYESQHLVLTLPEDDKAFIELQMTTLMRLAWSDLEHEVVYKRLTSLSKDKLENFLADNFRLLGETTVSLEALINLVEKHSK